MNRPKFSVLCLTYKRPEALAEAVFSVLNQTQGNFELIIVNDCPEQTIILPHPKIVVFNLPERFKTLGAKRNFALRQAVGELIVWLDDDDIILPHHLQSFEDRLFGCDWLTAQRAITFDGVAASVSPTVMASIFTFKREVARGLLYEETNFDEIVPFYKKIRESGRGMVVQINRRSYIYYRRPGSYSMFELGKHSVDSQTLIMEELPCARGEIVIKPTWARDYTKI